MINRAHERAVGVILGVNLSDFEFLLQNNRDIRSFRHERVKIKN